MKKYGKPNRAGVGTPLDPGDEVAQIAEVGLICTACQDVAEEVDPSHGLCDSCWNIGCRHGLIGGTKGRPVIAKNGIAKISKIVKSGALAGGEE